MTFLRRDCITSRGGALIAGCLSLIGTIIIIVPMQISRDWEQPGNYTTNRFENGFSELSVEIFLLLHGCSSILMMFGTIKGRPNLMFPWLGVFVSTIAISISMCVGIVISYILSTGRRDDLSAFSVDLAAATLMTAVETILYAVVYNHYKQLISGKIPQSSRTAALDATAIKIPINYVKV